MRPLAPDVQARLTVTLAGCVDGLRSQGWTGDFMAMAYGRDANGEDDREIYAADFADALGLATTPLDRTGSLATNLDAWLRELSTYRLMLGTRLHAALMAVAMGVPTVAIAYERKVHDAFVDLGLQQYLLSPDCSSAELLATALRAADNPEEFRRGRDRIVGQGQVAREFIATMVKRLG
jgi:hypothetical protein